MLTINQTEGQTKQATEALSKVSEFEKAKLLLINQMVDALLEAGEFPRTREGVDDAREAALERMCGGKHVVDRGIILMSSPPKYKYVCPECNSIEYRIEYLGWLDIPHEKR